MAKIPYTPPEGKEQYTLFQYVVQVRDEVIATLIPAPPDTSNDDNTSLLTLPQLKIALQVTWLPAKPAPESPMRQRGLIAVMRDIYKIIGLPVENMTVGIGHAYGAWAEFGDEDGE